MMRIVLSKERLDLGKIGFHEIAHESLHVGLCRVCGNGEACIDEFIKGFGVRLPCGVV